MSEFEFILRGHNKRRLAGSFSDSMVQGWGAEEIEYLIVVRFKLPWTEGEIVGNKQSSTRTHRRSSDR